ncbi:hypothetical protein [Leucobacter luti]|nr:hypothetical protein [Leucobacter luti]
MSNITRRQDHGLGKTASGGSGGSFASHERSAASPPVAHVDPSSLTMEELYSLNDELTQQLSHMGWNAKTDEDYDALNDLVLRVAEATPVERKDLVQKFADQGNAEQPVLHTAADTNTGFDAMALGEFEEHRREHYASEVASLLSEEGMPEHIASQYEIPVDQLDEARVSVAALREYDSCQGGGALHWGFAEDFDGGFDGMDTGQDKLAWAVRDETEREHLYDSYYGAAMWSTPRTDEGGNDLGKFQDEYDEEDLSDVLKNEMKDDLANFMISNRQLVNEYMVSDAIGQDRNERMAQLGHDFWLTRNRHGSGFWDRGLGELGDRMTSAAKTHGSVDLYIGDDGKIHGQ